MKRKLTTGTALALVALATLTGCSKKDLKYHGQTVEKPDETISSLETAWRQEVSDTKKVNVDENSRCYFQTSGDEVNEAAICGPVHFLGDNDQTWLATTLQGSQAGLGTKLAPEEGATFEKADRLPNTELYRPDGQKPKDDLNVPEPAVQNAKAGEVVEVPASESGKPADSSNTGRLQTPDGASYQVYGVSQQSRVGDAEHRRQAPDGSTFIQFSAVSNSDGYGNTEPSSSTPSSPGGSSSSPDQHAVRYTLTAGGKTVDVPLKEGGFAVAVPGDGKGAVLKAEYDGLAQEIQLDNLARRPSGAAGYYSGVKLLPSSSESSETPTAKWEQKPGDSKAQTAEADYDVKGIRTPYMPNYGWADPGQTFFVVSRKLSNLSAKADYHYYKAVFQFTGTKLTADGKEVKPAAFLPNEETTSSGFGSQAKNDYVVFQVPAAAKTFTLSQSISAKGTLESTSDSDKAPASLNATLPVPSKTIDFSTDGRNPDQGDGKPVATPKRKSASSTDSASGASSSEQASPVPSRPNDESDKSCVGERRRYAHLVNVDCKSAKYVADNVLDNGTDIAPNVRRIEDYACYAPTKEQKAKKEDVAPRVCVKDGKTESFEVWPKSGGKPVE